MNGYLFPAIGKDPAEEITPEFEATKKVGCRSSATSACLSKDGAGQCLRYPNLATFHPLRYLRGVADAFVKRGGALFADTAVTEVEEKDGAVTVRTENEATVQAGNAVVATNSPINDRSTCTPSSHLTAPTRWRSPSSATPSRMRSIGTRSIPITMSVSKTGAATRNISSSAAATTRPARRMTAGRGLKGSVLDPGTVAEARQRHAPLVRAGARSHRLRRL